jgi:hypothetical protein
VYTFIVSYFIGMCYSLKLELRLYVLCIALCKNLKCFIDHLLRFQVLLLYVDEMLKFLIKDVSVSFGN